MGMSHSANNLLSGPVRAETPKNSNGSPGTAGSPKSSTGSPGTVESPRDNSRPQNKDQGQRSGRKQSSDDRTREGQIEETERKIELNGKTGNQRESKDSRIIRPEDCKKKRPNKVQNTSDEHVNRKAKVVKEPPEVVEKKKRFEERASYRLMDTLSQKDRQKLLSVDAVLPFAGSSFINAMLKIHNSYRADHGVPALKLSKELNKLAQSRAETLVSMRGCKYMTSFPEVPQAVSENVFCSSSDNRVVAGAALACADWYSWADNFDYDNGGRKIGKKTITFLNMIWKETNRMGAGRAVSGSGKVVIVALYFPKPDVPFEIKQNVYPPLVSHTTLAPNQRHNSNLLRLKAL